MPDEEKTVVWTYMGRRVARGDKLRYCWLDENGEEAMFSKLKATAVGGQYEIVRIDESHVRLGVKFLGDSSDARKPEWVAEDRAAYMYVEQVRAEKRLTSENSKDGIGELSLHEVRHLIDRAGPRRHAMIALVLRYLGA